jgi:hypothetical protein
VKRNRPTLPVEAPGKIATASGLGISRAQVMSHNILTTPTVSESSNGFNLNTNSSSGCC